MVWVWKPLVSLVVYFLFIRSSEPLLEIKGTVVPRKSEKIGASRALGSSWILLLPMIGTLSELWWLYSRLCGSEHCLPFFVTRVWRWISLDGLYSHHSKANGDFFSGWERQNQPGCDGLSKGLGAAPDLCTCMTVDRLDHVPRTQIFLH